MNDLFCFLLAAAGFVSLCLSMTRHQRDLLARMLSRRASLVLRTAGFLLLAFAWTIEVADHGRGIGTVAWFGLLSLSSALVIASLTVRTSRIKALAASGKGVRA